MGPPQPVPFALLDMKKIEVSEIVGGRPTANQIPVTDAPMIMMMIFAYLFM